MLKGKNLILLFLVFFVFSMMASFAFAQGNLEVNYPTLPGAETPSTIKTILPDYILYLFTFAVGFSGLLIFGILVYSGFLYLTSGGNPSKQKDARDRIFAALLGLAVLLLSYVILTTLNPYLVILPFPDMKKLEIIAPENIPLDQQTLYSQEIPLSDLISGKGKEVSGGSQTSPFYEYEGALAKTRTDRILDLSKRIWEESRDLEKVSGDISKASQELLGFIEQCSCQNCSPMCSSCLDCYSQGPGNEDPCGPVRSQINDRQSVLSSKADELNSRLKKIRELNEELKIEREKLSNAFVELQNAWNMMKECLGSFSEEGKPRLLMNFDSFWTFKDVMETKKIVKKIEIQKLWPSLGSENDAITFYCSETPFAQDILTQVTGEDLQNATDYDFESEQEEPSRADCGDEIRFGETLDNSKDIADRLLKELDKIAAAIESLPKENDLALQMAALPDCTSCSACSCSCESVWNECCEKDALGDCLRCCEDCQGSCQGDPCPGTKAEASQINSLIQENHNKIKNAHDTITASKDEIKVLIEGERVPTFAEKILDKELPKLRQQFSACVDSPENWEKALSGESVLTKNIITCLEARGVCEEIEEDYECYGEDNPNALTNYFCAESEN